MRIVTKQLRLESHGFRYRVSLYFIYLYIKFDDKISIFKHNLRPKYWRLE